MCSCLWSTSFRSLRSTFSATSLHERMPLLIPFHTQPTPAQWLEQPNARKTHGLFQLHMPLVHIITFSPYPTQNWSVMYCS